MGWIPGWPTDPTTPKGSLDPKAVVLHRTYGHWPGDYSVGKQGIFQFLIGADPGHYVQFMDTTSVAYHCNGANFRAFGVEIEGTNDDPLNDWQVARLGEVLRYANSAHGIPLNYLDPITTPEASISVNHSNFVGIIAHRSVATDDGSSQHGDFVTVADFQKAVGSDSGEEMNDADWKKLGQWLQDTEKRINAHTDKQINDTIWGWVTGNGDPLLRDIQKKVTKP